MRLENYVSTFLNHNRIKKKNLFIASEMREEDLTKDTREKVVTKKRMAKPPFQLCHRPRR